MASALEDLLADGHPAALIVGCDSPTVPVAHIAEAAGALAAGAVDVAIGPAEDGGYYLIGLRRAQPALFADISWSTDRVMEQTMARAREIGLRVHLLPRGLDIDTPPDLDRLLADARAVAWVPRRTARCLQAISTGMRAP
jgi:glycosyltransferase A (GT-A) superfamily protein (DUF2064 family)